jgi:hypothetical protein
MKSISFDNYLFRCSSLGSIMTYPNKDTLSPGPKTFLGKIFKEEIYGKSKEIKSKYIDKGILVEQEAIEMYSRVLGKELTKNEERYKNEYITGIPDILDDVLVDIKSSWDYSTFPFTSEKIPNNDYYWQLQGYMALTDRETSKLVYCLVDTPDGIIFNDLKATAGSLGLHVDELPEDLVQEIWDSHKYSNLNPRMLIKEFVVERNQEDIDAIYKRVELARGYLNDLNQLLT